MQRSKNYSVAAGAASSRAVPPNLNRKYLILSPHATERYSIAFGEDATLDGGITVQPLTAPVFLTRDQIGSALADEVRVIASGAATIGIMEVSGP